jgi:hypothetical protein
VLRQRASLLLYRDGRNLNPGIVDQSGCLNSRSRRLWVRHDGLINLVHFRKIVNVGQVYSDGDYVFQFESSRFQHFLDVIESGFGLRTNASGGQLARIIRALLAGNVERIARDDAIAEGQPSGRRKIDGLVFLSDTGLPGNVPIP